MISSSIQKSLLSLIWQYSFINAFSAKGTSVAKILKGLRNTRIYQHFFMKISKSFATFPFSTKIKIRKYCCHCGFCGFIFSSIHKIFPSPFPHQVSRVDVKKMYKTKLSDKNLTSNHKT